MSEVDSATAILAAAVEPTDSMPADAPEVESPESTPESPDSTDAASTESEKTPDGGGDGTPPKAPTTAEIRASLKAFRDSNPDHAQAAKLLNDGYSRYEAYKQVFPDVDTARSVKAQLDLVGGLDGIANMQAVISSIEETDALLDAGDPKILDQIAEDAPKALSQLGPHYLTRWQKLDPESFAAGIVPHFVAALTESRFPEVVNYLATQLGGAIDATKARELQEVVSSMKQWFDGQKVRAERANSDALNPERQQITAERENIVKEQRQLLDSFVSDQVGPHIRNTIGGLLKPYAAALQGMPMAQRQDVARACMTTLTQMLKADKAYQTQIAAMMNARKPDRTKIVQLNKDKVNALARSVVEAVVKNYGLKAGAVKPAKGAVKSGADKVTGTQIIKINAQPKDADIDWEHEHMSDTAFIQHRAVLTEAAAKARGLKSRYVQW